MSFCNIGCGQTPTENWINFDNSLIVRLSNFPFVCYFLRWLKLIDDNQIKFMKVVRRHGIKFADARKKIPLPDNSLDVLYTSHMVEHLDQKEMLFFLKEAYRVLKPDGILRIVFPDLRKMIEEYNINLDADIFTQKTGLTMDNPKTLIGRIKYLIIGNRGHKHMHDADSLKRLLLNNNFKKVDILAAGETSIPDVGHLNLYERSGESGYIEAMK